jgi:RNA polymerase sigma factor (TIGR02999 family)
MTPTATVQLLARPADVQSTPPPRARRGSHLSEPAPGRDDVTALLAAWSEGDRGALDSLLPLIERELQMLARAYLRRERTGHTLQTTALVNEAFVKLLGQRDVRWQNRAHFYGIAAQAMRRILIDHARKIGYAKRGGGAVKLSLDEEAILAPERAAELVALDDALVTLAGVDERKCRVVEMRYFAGMSVEEIAAVLGLHRDTVTRDWRAAKAFLRRELERR